MSITATRSIVTPIIAQRRVIEAGSEDEALAQEDGNPHIGVDRVPLDLDKQSHASGQLNRLLSRPAIASRRKE
jgi:hypothetical protein